MTDKCHLHQVLRPSISEVHKVLTSWGGIIVHFSSVPSGLSSGLNLRFPEDLRHVLDGNAQTGISCSTVRPGDLFEDDGTGRRNSWGCIGVIVRGQTDWSLVCVDPHDCGSFLQPCGFRYCSQADRDMSIDEVVDSLNTRSIFDCNEWVVRDYHVIGVLIQRPFSVRALGEYANPQELISAFGNKPLFTLTRDGLYELTQGLTLKRQVLISELYP